MKQEKYYEYIVQMQNGKVAEKMPTARKSVMIYPFEAERLNSTVAQTKLFYEKATVETMKGKEELAETSSKDDKLEELRMQAKDLGVRGAHTMKEETLIERINEKLQ